MPAVSFLHLDVFTSTPFEGNQLAVFPDARGLTTAQMIALTREMNFSECTFILPAERPDTDVRMRIFTPGFELPMAGHPTIGSTFALAGSGVIAPGRARFAFGLNIGPTPVALEWREGRLHFAWMDQPLPEFRRPVSSRDEIARAVGVDPVAVAASGLPIEEVSCGVPFLYVPVATRKDVDAASPDPAAMRRLRSAFEGGHAPVFVFSAEGVDPDVTAYSRMFAPGLGLGEDPATGGASGPLGAYLVKHGVAARERWPGMLSLQGVAMGRPSRIHIAIQADEHGTVSRVQVGGQAVAVGAGEMHF
jgi:trans-2,3-dihydro-3-hydroxyanthranilate isomerase